MTQFASPIMGPKSQLTATAALGGSPTSSPVSGTGIGSGESSLTKHSDETLIPLVPVSSGSPSSGLSQSTPQLSSSVSSGEVSRSSKAVSDPPAPSSSTDVHSSSITVPMKISRIFQRFLVRCVHTFFAIAGVFFPLYYWPGYESMAYSAATFVGVGGTVYCLVRAIFLEVIPNWMLPKTKDSRFWRHLMNATYTAFLTPMLTHAVWKLPHLSAPLGLIYLTVSFGVPYPWLATFYPDIDQQPSYYKQKYDPS
jgi:hypothetical protein